MNQIPFTAEDAEKPLMKNPSPLQGERLGEEMVGSTKPALGLPKGTQINSGGGMGSSLPPSS